MPVPRQSVGAHLAEQATLSWGPNDKHRLLNTSLPRVDGMVKATGVAKYTYDAKPAGMLFGRLLLSPIARGKVSSYDDSAAKAIPGVKMILQGDPVAKSRDILFEGAVIAAVAAVTPEIAADAIKAIVVKFDAEPFIVSADDAFKPEAPKVWDSGNITKSEVRGDRAKVEDALSRCDATVDVEYRTPRLHHCCLETHGLVVDYTGGETATVYASTQATHSIPGDAAGQLGLKQDAVKAIVQNMGGGFGSKFGIGMPGLWACKLSKETSLPVRMMLTRGDEFIAGGNGPASVQKVHAGVNKDGTIAAFLTEQYSLGGIAGKGSLAGLPYIYDCKSVYRESSGIHTNEDASVALRAPGHPQASFAMESLMDELAEKIGMDPVEFRKKNQGDESWHRQLDVGAKAIGWETRNAKPDSGEGFLQRGIGCGLGQWNSQGHPQCVVTVTISKSGDVVASVGSQDLGTGTRTYIRAIVAEELGLNMDDVKEEIGDSDLGDANGSGGSTTAASLSPAVKDAAVKAKLAFAERIAPVLGASAADVRFDDRTILANDKKLTWQQACAALPAAGLSVVGTFQKGLSGKGVHGACFAEVEVNMRTGYIRPVKMVHVQDSGLPLNRLAMESQINGGMIQALGMALYEGRVMDEKLGIMLNPELGSYKLPGCLEMPELVPIIDDGDTRPEVIGIAESTNVAGVGAVANAVYNACGVRIRELPITPDKILMGLEAMKATAAKGQA